jgi:hypothetical protein
MNSSFLLVWFACDLSSREATFLRFKVGYFIDASRIAVNGKGH